MRPHILFSEYSFILATEMEKKNAQELKAPSVNVRLDTVTHVYQHLGMSRLMLKSS